MYTPTQAYLDTAGTFTIVTGRGTIIHTEPVPATVLAAPREDQEKWVTERVATKEHRTQGTAREYPYGFLFNLKRTSAARSK